MSAETGQNPAGEAPDPACWNCGKPLEALVRPVSRHAYCPHCAEAVHCCRMCGLFAPARPDQCQEDRTEPPTDKTVANFCEYFSLRETPPAASEAADSSARDRLEALFGQADGAPSAAPGGGADASHDDREARARSRLDALFGGDPEER